MIPIGATTEPAPPRRVLPVIVAALFAGTWPWFAAFGPWALAPLPRSAAQ